MTHGTAFCYSKRAAAETHVNSFNVTSRQKHDGVNRYLYVVHAEPLRSVAHVREVVSMARHLRMSTAGWVHEEYSDWKGTDQLHA